MNNSKKEEKSFNEFKETASVVMGFMEIFDIETVIFKGNTGLPSSDVVIQEYPESSSLVAMTYDEWLEGVLENIGDNLKKFGTCRTKNGKPSPDSKTDNIIFGGSGIDKYIKEMN